MKHGGSASEAEGDYNYTEADPSKVITDIKDMHEVARTLYHSNSSGPIQVVDVRAANRYSGEAPEPRPE